MAKAINQKLSINYIKSFNILILIFVAFWLNACSTAPYTGRQQLMILSPSEEMQMGLIAYQEVLKSEKISKDVRHNSLVTKVGQRIANAANQPDFKWEFKVIESPEANAFCLPGGKIAVYTGILPITQSEAGLAAVIGHEVAHALARHGGERVSQNMATQGLMLGADILLSNKGVGDAQKNLIMSSLGIGAQVGVLLPFSREHESEADYIGLILMAKAGYDPREAIDLWRRMKEHSEKKGDKPPEFLSTHPADETRIRQLSAWVPEAMTYYNTGKK